jgi:tRNA (cmo5U34)-methyltransferase
MATMLKVSLLPLFPMIVARERLTRKTAPRQPEPMVMGELQGAVEYDEAGATVLVPLHQYSALALSDLLPERGTLVDLGCGSGRLLARLAQGRPDVRLIGLDLSEPMLDIGRQLLTQEGLADRVELRIGDITSFDAQLSECPDVVSCNLALHQLPSEELVSRCLEAIRRTRERTGCAIYISDLARLRNSRTWPAMLSNMHLPGPMFRRDGIASERAAFTFAELTNLLQQAGLADLQHGQSRPLGENQLHWIGPHDRTPRPGRWHEVPLPEGTKLSTRLTARSFSHIALDAR